ncbi:MAG: hypothetical protein AAFX99_02490 [Myxococcota bacterium]
MSPHTPPPILRLIVLALAALTLTALLVVGCDDTTSGDNTASTADSGSPESDTANSAADTDNPEDTSEPADDTDRDSEEADTDPIGLPNTLVIDPADAFLNIAVGEQRAITYTATWINAEGQPEAVQPRWEVNPSTVGTMDSEGNGVFTTVGVGGQTEVTAVWQDQRATTSLTLNLTGHVADPEGQPGDSEAFEGLTETIDPQTAPELVYPEDGTLFPQNLTGVTIQWFERGNTLFRVRFQGRRFDLTTTTRSPLWEPPAELWRAVIRSLGPGEQVRITVEGLDNSQQTLHRSEQSIRIGFSSDTVGGAIYYWSTSNAGLMRLAVGETEPEPFFTPGTPPGSPCVGCHALSRDGKRIAFNTGPIGLPIGPFMQISAEDPTAVYTPLAQNINGMQPTFNPDGTRIVTGWEGVLTEREADGRCSSDRTIVCSLPSDCPQNDCVTGQPVTQVPTPNGWKGGFADWSPNDRYLVAAGTTFPLGIIGIDFSMPNSGLFIVPRRSGNWGQPEILLEPRNADESNGHPAFSPDSRWIVFDHIGPGFDHQGTQLEADLWIMSVADRTPIPLQAADQSVGVVNTWPKWAPFSGQHLWLAFSSTRSYGRIDIPADVGPQIWITAIDPVKAALGEDPSAPAFWLPYQDSESGNHVPYWALFSKEPDE